MSRQHATQRCEPSRVVFVSCKAKKFYPHQGAQRACHTDLKEGRALAAVPRRPSLPTRSVSRRVSKPATIFADGQRFKGATTAEKGIPARGGKGRGRANEVPPSTAVESSSFCCGSRRSPVTCKNTELFFWSVTAEPTDLPICGRRAASTEGY